MRNFLKWGLLALSLTLVLPAFADAGERGRGGPPRGGPPGGGGGHRGGPPPRGGGFHGRPPPSRHHGSNWGGSRWNFNFGYWPSSRHYYSNRYYYPYGGSTVVYDPNPVVVYQQTPQVVVTQPQTQVVVPQPQTVVPNEPIYYQQMPDGTLVRVTPGAVQQQAPPVTYTIVP